jgi:cysteine desulfurase/selenocysteine lyase
MKGIKRKFDILKKKELVFFDNSASTLKPKNVCDAVDYYNRFESVNTGRGIYKLAFEVTSKLERVRQKVKDFLNAKNYDIVFVKNTSEAINLIATSHVGLLIKKDDEIIISELEHNSNYLPWLEIANKNNAKLVKVNKNDFGKITFENFVKVVTNKTKFVALNYASNTFGSVTEIEKISNYCKEKQIQILVDGSQVVSHKKVDLDELNADFFAFSGYKMFAPTGVGVLAIKSEIAKAIRPIFFGGGAVLDVQNNIIETRESPYKFEVGTHAVASIIGLGEAIDFIENIGLEKIEKYERDLTDYFIAQTKDIQGFKLYNKNTDLPIFLFNLGDLHAHDAATFYDEFNIMLRAGNHCAILAMEKLGEVSSLRASLNFVNTKKDIDKFVFATKKILKYFEN